jgi:hypothetical protein
VPGWGDDLQRIEEIQTPHWQWQVLQWPVLLRGVQVQERTGLRMISALWRLKWKALALLMLLGINPGVSPPEL